MRYLFLMLLALSLPVIAMDAPQAPSGGEKNPPVAGEGKQTSPGASEGKQSPPGVSEGKQSPQTSKRKDGQKKRVIESKELCDPIERTRMPGTFY